MWFNCACGYRFHDNTDNLPFKGHVLANEDMEEFADSFDKYADAPQKTEEDKRRRDDIVVDALLMMRDIYQCPKCGTIYFHDFNSRRLFTFVHAEPLDMDDVITEKLRSIAEKNEETEDKNLLRSYKMFDK